MLFDYVMNPIICVIWCSRRRPTSCPLPFAVWATFFAVLFTFLNLQGVKTSARTNAVIAFGLVLVIVLFLVAAFRYLAGVPLDGAALARPFYDPATFSWAQGLDRHEPRRPHLHRLRRDLDPVRGGEEPAAQHPARDRDRLPLHRRRRAASLSTSPSSIWPDWTSYPDVDTAFVHVAGRAGGPVLFAILNGALLVANVGSGMGAHLGASRLLYGMGRDDAIPRRFFGVVNPRTHVPSNNMILVGVLALAGAFTVSYGLGAELLNFGAFIAFMGVNLSALVHYWWRAERRRLVDLVPPLLGFLICAYLWWSLSVPARIAGFVWLLTGIAYGAWKTKGFRKAIEFREAGD